MSTAPVEAEYAIPGAAVSVAIGYGISRQKSEPVAP